MSEPDDSNQAGCGATLMGTGLVLIVVGSVMMQAAAGVFTATESPGPVIGFIGAVSFFTWSIPILVGFGLLVASGFRKRPPHDRA
jgi:hypothetical protein